MTRVFIKTFGCSVNHSDSESLAGMLKSKGFEIVDDIEKSEAVIVNTCIVKGPTEKKILKYLEEIKDYYRPTVVAGCMPKVYPEKLDGYTIIGTNQFEKIVGAVEEAMHDNFMSFVSEGEDDDKKRVSLPKIRENPIIEIIPICAGCLGKPCAYCIVKSARGDLLSYPKDSIIEQVKKSVREGVKEIWLTAQDTGCYGADIGSSLPELLRAIVSVEGNFKVRLGMANPNHIKDNLDELIEIFKNEKMFKFIHIPIQSGNDRILALMDREYTVDDFRDIVKRIRAEIPEMTFSTDMICGFPTETKEEFNDSVNLVKEIGIDVLNVSRFWPRDNTKSAMMEQHLGGVTKERSTFLKSMHDWVGFETNKKWKNWEGSIIIDEEGKENTSRGRNYAYKPIIVQGNYKIGTTLNVKVLDITKHDLRAVVKSKIQ